MAVGDIWRLSLIGQNEGQYLAVTTAHVKFLTGGATFAGAAAEFKTGLIDLLQTKQSSDFSWTGINGYRVYPTPPVVDAYSTGFPVVGDVNSQVLPLQVAMVVTLRTANVGRSYRGRQYLPGISQATQTTSVFDANVVAAIQVYYDDLIAALGSGGSSGVYEWGIWSRKDGAWHGGLTGSVVRNVPATQRRRRPGVGA